MSGPIKSIWGGASAGSRTTAAADRGWAFTPSGSGGGAEVSTGGPAPASDGDNPFNKPGAVEGNILDPVGTVQQQPDQIGDFLKGLKASLFGTDQPDAAGQHGGLIDIPVVSDLARFGTEVIGNTLGAGLTVVGGALDVVGGVFERIPNPLVSQEDLERQFSMIPANDPIRVEAERLIAEGRASGSLIGPPERHILSDAIHKFNESKKLEDTDLYSGLFDQPPATLADSVNWLFDSFAIFERPVQRTIAGMDRPGSGGNDQLDLIMLVGDGKAQWDTSGFLGTDILKDIASKGLTEPEQIVYDKVKSGQWTRDEALDFMAAKGLGYSHNPAVQIAATVALDPLNAGSLGAGAAAKLGMTGVRLARNVSVAERAVIEAQRAFDAGETLSKVKILAAEKNLAKAKTALLREAGSSSSKNILGKFAEKQGTSDLVRLLSKPYVGMQGTSIGKMAKGVRTIIDPFHAMRMPTFGRGADAAVDLTSEVVVRAGIGAMGDIAHQRAIGVLEGIDPALREIFDEGLETFYGNRARSVVMEKHRAHVLTMGQDKIDALRRTNPNDIVDEIMASQQRSILQEITRDVNRYRIQTWSEEQILNLAQRMADIYGVKSVDEWVKILKSQSKDVRSLFHQATYGKANTMLLDAVAEMAGNPAIDADLLQRAILLNRNTLTRLGADGIIQRLEEFLANGDLDGALRHVREMQTQYDILRYVSYDPSNPQKTVDELLKYLKRERDSLPMQLTEDEAAKIATTPLGELATKLHGEWTIGFRPDEKYLWGLERMNVLGGRIGANGNVWIDHVARTGIMARPARRTIFNVLGQGIEDVYDAAKSALPRKLQRPLDYMEAGARALGRVTDGGMIVEAARQKFVGEATLKYGKIGLSKAVADDMWEALQNLTNSKSTVVNPRGWDADTLWHAVEGIIPRQTRGQMNKRMILNLVLEAYDGDLRFIGVTQKLTSRMKAVLGKTGVNWAGQIAEHAWPLMKFRLNLVFQAQERIEPWVLNAQRGVTAAIGSKMSPADLRTEALLHTQLKHSLVRMGDADQGEYAAEILAGNEARGIFANKDTAAGKMAQFADALLNVKGAKRVNMLRTFRKGLGKEMRKVYDARQPGLFDELLSHEQIRLGALVPEDDFAIQLITENLLGNDIIINRLMKAGKTATGSMSVDFKAAISPARWAQPQDLGQINALDIDEIAIILDLIPRGMKEASEANLRRGLAAGTIKMDEIRDALISAGADMDFIRRVENALNFSWDGFWAKVAEKFSLDELQLQGMQEFVGRSASMRGMSPVEYLSQVFSPTIIDGEVGAVGALGRMVDTLKAGKITTEPALAQLAAKEGATFEDFARQFTGVFAQHLDPSAKRALLMAYREDLRKAVLSGDIRFDMRDVEAMFDANAENWLADRIIKFANGEPGTGAHRIVTDTKVGSTRLRLLRDEVISGSDRQPLAMHRRHFDYDDELATLGADEFEALPEVPKPGVFPDTDWLFNSIPKQLESRHGGVPMLGGDDILYRSDIDVRTGEAYRAFVKENRAQFKKLRDAGIRVEVTKVDPYAAATLVMGRNRQSFMREFMRLTKKEEARQARVFNDIMIDLPPDSIYRKYVDRSDPIPYLKWNKYTDEEIEEWKQLEAMYGGMSDDARSAIAYDDPNGVLPPRVDAGELFDGLAKTIGERKLNSRALHSDIRRGVLRVSVDDLYHPLMTPVQAFEAKAVHLAFGYGMEGLDLGKENIHAAAAAHGMMYSDEARAAFATETIGRESATYLGKNVPFKTPKVPRTWQEYTDKYGHMYESVENINRPNRAEDVAAGASLKYSYQSQELVGPGAKALSPAEQEEFFGILDRIQSEFPDIKLNTVDVVDLSDPTNSIGWRAMGVTMYNGKLPTSGVALIMDKRFFGPGGAAHRQQMLQRWAESRQYTHFGGKPRKTLQGVPHNVGVTLEDVLRHEFGHVTQHRVFPDMVRAPGIGNVELIDDLTGRISKEYIANLPKGGDELRRFMNRWNKSIEKRWISEYGYRSKHEAFAELFDAAFYALERGVFDDLPDYVRDPIMEFREIMTRNGYFIEGGVQPHPLSGRTFSEINAGTREMRAPAKAGLLSDETLATFTERLIGRGKYAESNPDVARAAQYFAKWSQEALFDALDHGNGSAYADVFKQIGNFPIGEAVPYNLDEALLVGAAHTAMANKWRDAYRLQYFAQNRRFVERSINHPMFGMYPASYMWGKIAPELVRFIVKEPFGTNTGAMMYTMMDIQRAVALQREFDPEFDAKIEEMGHSQAMGFLSYLLPGVPWDVGASAPAWARNLAAQGNDNIQAVEQGGLVSGIDLSAPLVDTVKKLNPMVTWIPWGARAINEVEQITPLRDKTQEELDEMIQQQQENQPGEGEAPSTTGPTPATDLQPQLEQEMLNLRAILGG